MEGAKRTITVRAAEGEFQTLIVRAILEKLGDLDVDADGMRISSIRFDLTDIDGATGLDTEIVLVDVESFDGVLDVTYEGDRSQFVAHDRHPRNLKLNPHKWEIIEGGSDT